MTIYTYRAEQWLARTIDEVFQFFADARNLEELTPRWLRFQIIDRDVVIRRGTLINYRLRIHGIPIRWQSEITEWEPPRRFVDVQRRGPYKLWVHEHTFEAQGGGTLVRDTVQYSARGGVLMRKFLIAPDLERIFSHRKARLESIFGERQ